MDVIIFGTSKGKDEIESYLDFNKITVKGYIDNDVDKQSTMLNNKPIYSPSELENLNFDYIILASRTYQYEMQNQLLNLGIAIERIVMPPNPVGPTPKKLISEDFRKKSAQKAIFKKEYLKNDNYFLVAQNQSIWNPMIDYNDFKDYLLNGIDFVRVSTVDLLARELEANGVEGAIAELGVYQGDFTKYLSCLFPNRKLYLFDTFQGFAERDVTLEQKKGYSNANIGHLGNTSEEVVLNKIFNPNRATIIKGYFPESIPEKLDTNYAFVNIDVDLYKPTYEGLKYFYSKLSKGGYILIHDYNFDYYSGVKAAVRLFCEEKNLTVIPLADYHGSVIISK